MYQWATLLSSVLRANYKDPRLRKSNGLIVRCPICRGRGELTAVQETEKFRNTRFAMCVPVVCYACFGGRHITVHGALLSISRERNKLFPHGAHHAQV